MFQDRVAQVLAFVDDDVGIRPVIIIEFAFKVLFKDGNDFIEGQGVVLEDFFSQSAYIMEGNLRIVIMASQVLQEEFVETQLEGLFSLTGQHPRFFYGQHSLARAGRARKWPPSAVPARTEV